MPKKIKAPIPTEPIWKHITPDFEPKPGDKWLSRYKTPDMLWKAAVKYFQWCDDNPIYLAETASYQGDISSADFAHRRAYTLIGLCAFINFSDRQLKALETRYDEHIEQIENGEKEEMAKKPKSGHTIKEEIADFRPVINAIKAVIHTQRFEGALVGEFNANLTARSLGIGEAIDHTSSDGSMKPPSKIELVAAEDYMEEEEDKE